ncbi:membrane protein insertion efficiency factor YidD [Paremcibacter congregatus]|uniref:Putative membrane protein insertion efficiency factor n=2 Tax=Paremcibacter congregatus TaxID=2043170 RepID=A0A2G4YWL1_9PROT|nr:membrane protein insertion efficiency factor YidD [Paremcibacter congregatus]QDE29148.1 membrane protein insertion efficiency factor YidD [Paremcibacter congregatus]
MITVYRYTVSPLLGKNCRYLPTCSDYAYQAIDRFGPFKGTWLALRRIGRCHPWGGEGYDPVPDRVDNSGDISGKRKCCNGKADHSVGQKK